MKIRIKNKVLIILLLPLLFSCNRNHSPKPLAYFRIDFPEKAYHTYQGTGTCPFIFDYPVYGQVVLDERPTAGPCWINVQFPKYKSTIYLTYHEIDGNFDVFLEHNWNIIYKTIAQKADAVVPSDYFDTEHHLYGTVYDIKGNAASPVEFFVTDSVKHFLRGALYFNARPNQDSLAPAINFFKDDIVRLVESVRWKE